jgi:NAD(P)-dependent dehydrogenase (short-subunit alcohol dehydrogenase family)
MERFDLNGKVALVTGAARGIGFETAKALVARGASVVVVDLRSEDAVAAAAQLHGERALGLAADVTDRDAMQKVIASTVERFGRLDVVVANAGVASRPATFRAMSEEAFDRVLDVNLHGVLDTVRAALPEIVERGGHVVVVASVYAFINGAGATPYAIAKAGVEQFGRALRVELAPHGASASVAYFGFIDTEMVRQTLDADASGDDLKHSVPRVLRKRLHPSVAGEAIVAGIERRAPRIIRPRRWRAISVLRGVVNPLFDRKAPVQLEGLVREIDTRPEDPWTSANR